MTVLERAAQEVADAAARPPFLFQAQWLWDQYLPDVAQRSDKSASPVTAVRYLGTIHDFMLLNALRETNAARGATAQTINSLRSAFGAQSQASAGR